MPTNLAKNRAAGAFIGQPPIHTPTDPLFSDRDAAAMLGCGRSTLWRWAAEGVLPKPIKIGGMSRWRKSDIEAVIAKAEAQREAA